MAKMKHTLGGWTADLGDGTLYMNGVPLDVNAADLSPITASYEEGMANARLIAAAPELLEALQSQLAAHFATWMAARADYEDSTLSASLFEKEPEVKAARAAISKATGGAS